MLGLDDSGKTRWGLNQVVIWENIGLGNSRIGLRIMAILNAKVQIARFNLELLYHTCREHNSWAPLKIVVL